GVVVRGPSPAKQGPGRPVRGENEGGAEPANRRADVRWSADAGLKRQPRRASFDVDTMFEKVVRQRPVPVVANERRADKPRVAMIARGRNAERHAEASGTYVDKPAARREQPLGVRFDHLQTVGIGVRRAERVR